MKLSDPEQETAVAFFSYGRIWKKASKKAACHLVFCNYGFGFGASGFGFVFIGALGSDSGFGKVYKSLNPKTLNIIIG